MFGVENIPLLSLLPVEFQSTTEIPQKEEEL